MKVKFKVYKRDGCLAIEDELEEEQIPSFLRGTECSKAVYEKDEFIFMIVNPEAKE